MTDDEILKVVQAHKDGKQIQFKFGGRWENTDNPSWSFDITKYRIKPEPHYVPYDSIDEVERDKWVRYKGESLIRRIDGLAYTSLNRPVVSVHHKWRILEEMFEDFEYEDGTPFGKLVSE